MTRKSSLADRLTQGAPLAVLLVLSLLVLYQIRSVLKLIAMPTASFAIAILLSLIFQTLLHQIEKFVKKPWLAVLILCVGILAITVAIPLIVIPGLSDRVGKLSSALPQYVSDLTAKSEDLHEQHQFVPDLPREIDKFNNFLRGAIESLPLILTQALGITIEPYATVILALYITKSKSSSDKPALAKFPQP